MSEQHADPARRLVEIPRLGGLRELPSRILIRAVRVYRLAHQGRVPSCRFLPTCSAFALEAIEAYGALGGSWLAIRRVSRCHPWGRSGFDPVPSPAALSARNAHPHRKAQTC